MTNRFTMSLTGEAGVLWCRFRYTDTVLKSHKRAIAEIKSGRQRVEKAKQERDKLKEKLKQAQARLATEKERLRRSQEKLES